MDPLARRDLRDLLKAQANEGRAVLVSSHILTELADMCTHVAIMHKGKLRAVGSVDEIAARFSSAAHCPVKLSLLEGMDRLATWLAQRDDVTGFHSKEQRARLLLAGEEKDAAALLRSIVEAGFAVTGFEVERASLEDVLTELHRNGDNDDVR